MLSEPLLTLLVLQGDEVSVVVNQKILKEKFKNRLSGSRSQINQF